MPQQSTKKRFESCCVACDTWIVSYQSATLPHPVYLVWYTDRVSGDRLLMHRNGPVFTAETPESVAAAADAQLPGLVYHARFPQWLERVVELTPTVCNAYDADYIEQSLCSKRKLSLKAMDALSNFIDLFGDYANSLENVSHLQAFRDNPVIESYISHYYRFIFWPRLQHGAQFRDAQRPALETDHSALLTVFREMRAQFEAGLNNSSGN
ncbi:hypothetical protein [Chitinophaga rhizosphaerae]|uniref:hypothetical protein n=1 Tax=Chitinophaga rhizosphaerae TaxID=1864947 RepID=UPI000F8020F0|nr:hypothetical protein [Chitinophaga rhizosphaerae]